MEIIKLPKGQRPPVESDCIRIYSTEAGMFDLMGTALHGDDSVILVSDEPYATHAAATDDGLAWANGLKVAKLYVATDPALSEADKPL